MGLTGGRGRESTVPYYRTINERVRECLGGPYSAHVALCAVDLALRET
jgi:aspartate racemase